MKPIVLLGLLALLTTGPVAAQQILVEVTADDLDAFVPPEDIRVERTTVNGQPAIKLTHLAESALSVVVVEKPIEGLDDTHVSYSADVSSEDVSGRAYLELWAAVGGNAYYFSRALNDTFRGTQAIRKSATPFYLEAGHHLESVRLGVRFEGPGTVTLSNMVLHDQGPWQGIPGSGRWGAVAGALVGIGAGIWACISAWLSSRGRLRRAVLTLTLMLAGGGGLTLVAGVLAWATGAVWAQWYPPTLLGMIVVTVFGSGYWGLRRTYQSVETRRMLAMDMD